MNERDTYQKKGFQDSVCTCSKCGHKAARECFKIGCNCCKETDHSMIMDGIEGFETS